MTNEFLEIKQGLIHVADEAGIPQPIYPMTTSDMVIDPSTGNSIQHIMNEVGIESFTQLSKEFGEFAVALQEELGDLKSVAKVATLNSGENGVDVERDSFVRIAEIPGRTIVNHLPLFDSGLWINAFGTIPNSPKSKIIEPNHLECEVLSSHTADGIFYCPIIVKPNTVYTFSAEHNGIICVGEGGKTPSEGSIITNDGQYSGAQSVTFTSTVDGKLNVFVRTGTINNVDGIVEKGKFFFKNASLVEGAEVLPFVANVKGIKNPTITNYHGNLIRDFTHSNYADASTSTYSSINRWVFLNSGIVVEPNLYLFRSTTNIPRINIPVTAGETYTLSAVTDTKVNVSTNNGSMEESTQIASLFYDVIPTGGKVTFVVPEGVKYVRVMFGDKTTPAPFTVSNVALVKGTEKFDGEFKTSSVTALTTLHEGESLRLNEIGKLGKLKRVEEKHLTGDLDWSLGVQYVGYKYVKVPSTFFNDIIIDKVASEKSPTPTMKVVKSTGEIIKHNPTFSIAGKDHFNYGSNTLTLDITIANEDSGWGDKYTPTPDEIKAYFYGWKMYDGETNPGGLGVYNRTDGLAKYWVSMDSYSIADNIYVMGINILPTSPPTQPKSWNPYKLIYDMGKPSIEEVQSIGSLTLSKGVNNLVVTEGKIVRERVNPVWLRDDFYLVNPGGEQYKSAWLKHFTTQVLQVYKNGKPYHRVDMGISTVGRRPLEFVIKGYDPSAIYEVDYIPYGIYNFTAPVKNVSLNYASSLSTLVEQLVEVGANLEGRTNTIENLLPHLASGAVMEVGENANGKYTKYMDGTLEFTCVAVMKDIRPNEYTEVTFPTPIAFTTSKTYTLTSLAYSNYGEDNITIRSINTQITSFALGVKRASSRVENSEIGVAVLIVGRWR